MESKQLRGRIYDDITQCVGDTPLIRMRRVVGDAQATVAAKLENFNPLWCGRLFSLATTASVPS